MVLQTNSLILEGIRLGQGVNLLHGPAPFPFMFGSLSPSRRAPLREFPVEITRDHTAGWQPLCVTVHQDVASLVDRLWSCHVEPHRCDGPEFSIHPGRLLRDDRDELVQRKRLGEMLGVELVEGRSYLLFELRRIDGRADHEVTATPTRRSFDRSWHVTPDWRKAGSRLRPGQRIHDADQHDAVVTADMAQAYVESFYEFGTHCVSAVEVGDMLLQVVALRPESSAQVVEYWHRIGNGKPVTGALAMTFGAFLGPTVTTEMGRILSLANDPQLPVSLAWGIWSDPGDVAGASLLGMLRTGPRMAEQVLSSFTAIAPVYVELTSLSRFLEYFRAINFERILRGALFQRWGNRVHLPLRRLPSIARTVDAAVLPYANHMEGDLRRNLAEAEPGCYQVLSVRADWNMAHNPCRQLLAQIVDAAPSCHRAPRLRLSDQGFEQFGIACQTMVGALILENESGTRRDVVVDGLRFTDAAPELETGWPRVRVRGPIYAVDTTTVAHVLPAIRRALAGASVTLARADATQQHAAAGSFAGWLARALPVHTHEREMQRLRLLALYQSQVRASAPACQPHIEKETCVRLHDQLSRLSSLAIEADALIRDHDTLLCEVRCGSRSNLSALHTSRAGLQRLRSVRQEVLVHYLAFLEEIKRSGNEALERAGRAQRAACTALADAVVAVRDRLPVADGAVLSCAKGTIFHAIVSEAAGPPTSRANEQPLSAGGGMATTVTGEFVGRAAYVRAQIAQLEVLEALCAALADTPQALDVAERALAAWHHTITRPIESERLGAETLQSTLLGELRGGVAVGPSIDQLVVAWERFEATRDQLVATRIACCQVRLEIWYHAVLELGGQTTTAVEGPVASAAAAFQLERFHLLTVLGQALRRLQAATDSAGVESPERLGSFEPGAIGYLIWLKLGSLVMQPVASAPHDQGATHASADSRK